MWRVGKIIHSGTHTYCHLSADTPRELQDAARRLKLQVHGGDAVAPCRSSKGLAQHLDLDLHKRDLAIRYGATEE